MICARRFREWFDNISHTSYLPVDTASWLRWICTSPTPVPGIIQGVLPPLILAILFIILPMILRALAWYECIPRYSLISISVYKRYFFFLLL